MNTRQIAKRSMGKAYHRLHGQYADNPFQIRGIPMRRLMEPYYNRQPPKADYAGIKFYTGWSRYEPEQGVIR